MTNREKFKDYILNVAFLQDSIAVDKKTLEPCTCSDIVCSDCIAYEGHCRNTILEWAESEYVEPCPFEKDELVEVSDDGKQWVLRYFSHQEGRYVYCYEFGFTSKEISEICTWKYCRKYGTLGGLVKEQK